VIIRQHKTADRPDDSYLGPQYL